MAVIMGCGPDQVSTENLYFASGKGVFYKGGAVGLAFSSTKITYTGTAALDVGTAGIKTDLIAGSTGTTGNFNINLVDNLANALTIKEGTNPYLRFVTTDSSEAVNVYKTLQVDTVRGLTAGTGLFKIALQDNLADALSIQEAANKYVTFVTADGSETVDVLKTLRTDTVTGLSGTGLSVTKGLVVSSNGATAITTTRPVTRSDSGSIFTVAQSSAYTITVATPTSAGERYIFQCVSPGAFDVSIVATACTFEGTIVNDVTSVIPATGSTLKFASGAAALGDYIELIATSTSKFFVRAVTSTAGGITVS